MARVVVVGESSVSLKKIGKEGKISQEKWTTLVLVHTRMDSLLVSVTHLLTLHFGLKNNGKRKGCEF